MAIKLGWSPLPVEQFGFGGGSVNLPLEADGFWIWCRLHGKSIFFVFFYKKKR
jgi:hypothetical protein